MQQLEFILVPHTHWDREWYLTFQQFRIKLVRTVDQVLDILDQDPDFTAFMLDGQTIVLEDYLEVRPQEQERLQRHARAGRLLTGPWYLQPDEFLVSGESLIRNLMVGFRMAADYGGPMPVGYVPDTFGHIAQLPQILRGFGLDNAVFWRGVGEEARQSEFIWRGPDGSEVLVAHLADEAGYANARSLPLDVDAFLQRLEIMKASLLPRATTNTLLLMNGSDHLPPQAGLPAVIAAANARLDGARVRIGTLPQYLDALRASPAARLTLAGEMRSSQRAHLLPGVLSTRMWIKQHNMAGEHLLTGWAEPSCAWAWALGAAYPTGLLRLAWKYLLHNHPHDSICGCSIDQVHAEMATRFAQSAQIAEELTIEALQTIASTIDTRTLLGPATDALPVATTTEATDPLTQVQTAPAPARAAAEALFAPVATPVPAPDGTVRAPLPITRSGLGLVVFNPAGGPRTDVAVATVQLPPGLDEVEVVDDAGNPVRCHEVDRQRHELVSMTVDKALLAGAMTMVEHGRIQGNAITDIILKAGGQHGTCRIEVTIAELAQPNHATIRAAEQEINALLADPAVTGFEVVVREAPALTLAFQARDIPAHGYRTYVLRATSRQDAAAASLPTTTVGTIGNEWFQVTADPSTGMLAVLDKRTGTTYAGLNRFVDGGDVGDLYTYCPPLHDQLITTPMDTPQITVIERNDVRSVLRVRQTYALPAGCATDRQSRAAEYLPCAITSEVTVAAGVGFIAIRTEVDNRACDHRLRVLFPAPIQTDHACAEGTFMVNRRPSVPPRPPGTDPYANWAEEPTGTQPQKRFVDISDGRVGLAVLNQGLPEYEILPQPATGSTTIALTLLRCTGWLSRGDLRTRRGHAGPAQPTPEAQCLGTHVFAYALVPHPGDWEQDEALVQRLAEAFNLPLRTVLVTSHTGSLPLTASFITLTPRTLLISAIKRAEREEALVVRCYNPLGTVQHAELTLSVPFREALLANLNEEPLALHTDGAGDNEGGVITAGRRVTFTVPPYGIRTVLFRLS